MAAVRDVVVRFLGNASGLNDAAQQGEKAVGKFSDRTNKMATVGLAGVAAFGAGLVATLKGGVEGLQEGEEAEAKFAQTMSKVPASLKLSQDAIKSYAESVQAKTRFSYEDSLATSGFLAAQDGVQAALKAGVVDVEHLTEMSLNLATVQGKDGPAAAAQLAKWLAAPEKATAALRKAGISLTAAEQEKIKAWTKSGDAASAQELILTKVQAKTKGAAEAAGQTTAGQLERAKAAWGEVQETLATQIIPVITRLVGWLLKVTTWAQNNPGKVKLVLIVLGSLAAVIGSVSLAIKAWTFITKVHTAAMAALNVVMFANPAVLITVAILALAAALFVAWKKSETFRRIVTAAFDAVKGAASAVWNWFKGNWPLLLAILTGPFGLAVLAVVKNWDKIKDGATAVKEWITGKFDAIVDFVTGLPGKIASAASGMWDGVKDAFKAAINWIIDGWNRMEFTMPSVDTHIPGVGKIGGWTLGLPDIPRLAAGGTVSRRGWTMVGESGPEFLNLGRGAQVVPLDRSSASFGPLTVEIHASGPTLRDIVRVEVRETNRTTRTAALAGARRALI